MATYQAQLDEINTAITDLLSGKLQSYTIGGRTVNKLTLDPLLREFVMSPTGQGIATAPTSGASTPTAAEANEEVGLRKGGIYDLAPGEEIETADPSRPNANFDPFVLALCRQIGVALELPYELLIKHFTSSYSASRAAPGLSRSRETSRPSISTSSPPRRSSKAGGRKRRRASRTKRSTSW